ncbi:hypothetical protein D3C71_1590250 [compost metagenome]
MAVAALRASPITSSDSGLAAKALSGAVMAPLKTRLAPRPLSVFSADSSAAIESLSAACRMASLRAPSVAAWRITAIASSE